MLKKNRTLWFLFWIIPIDFLSMACGSQAEIAPAVIRQPFDATVPTGYTATFSVIASGSSLHYQWQKDGINVGTDSDTLTIEAAQASDAGSYLVTVSNSRASVASSPATLTVSTENLTNSLTRFGVTWVFDQAYRTGKFNNGDPWVVGPVKIIAINPMSIVRGDGRTINGSMLNPAISWDQGYDSRMMGDSRGWIPELNVARPGGNDLSSSNPLIIDEPASLVSGISYPDTREAKNVRVMAVLTVLDTSPPDDAFRPPYIGSDKNIRHRLSEVQAGLLLNLAMPSEVWMTVSEVAAYFEKPWVEHMRDWQKELFCAPDNMPSYGREVASAVSSGALMLLLDVDQEQKALLLRRFIQLGLDNYGILQVPNGIATWTADGGHMSGRAFPIIFAGYLLGDQDMLNMMQKSGQYAYQNGHYEGNLPDDYIHFGEIDQTFYVTQRDVDRTHSASWSPDPRSVAIPYEVSDIGTPEWGINHVHAPGGDNKNWDAIYRATCTPAWSGFVLASRLLNITDQWNHPPLFDYMDRWVNQGEEAGFTDLSKRMWATYR